MHLNGRCTSSSQQRNHGPGSWLNCGGHRLSERVAAGLPRTEDDGCKRRAARICVWSRRPGAAGQLRRVREATDGWLPETQRTRRGCVGDLAGAGDGVVLCAGKEMDATKWWCECVTAGPEGELGISTGPTH
jgi:hypothetical protein